LIGINRTVTPMSDENVHSCLHLMYHGWKAARHIQVCPSIRADAYVYV